MRRLIFFVSIFFVAAGPAAAATDTELLDDVQSKSFLFFWNEANPDNGLIRDRSDPDSPCSIASTGFGLSAICVGVDRGWVTRANAAERVETTLETFWRGPQGTDSSGTIGYRGFFYHFLDMDTAVRTWNSELSSIDTALLLAGVLDAGQYFSGEDTTEVHIRQLADSIYTRVNWEFMRNFASALYMGWKPGTGFSGFGFWRGYNEAMIMYILALGSPTHAPPTTVWNSWLSTYSWQTHYGQSYVPFPPLFGHQYSHCWVDFRGIQDIFMQFRGIDYFENSRRATLAQQAYCIANPGGFVGYGEFLWGITASDDPFGYSARGAPPAQDDNGTLVPSAVAGSLPFAPDICMPTLHNLYDNYPALWGPYGFRDAFNLTIGWYDTDYLGIDQGPIVLMIENFRTGSVWERFMSIPAIQDGLVGAGFEAATVAVDDLGPRGLSLASEPNPLRDSGRIRFQLAQRGRVQLTLYDARGRVVERLLDEEREAGAHAVQWSARRLDPGLYFCRLEANGNALTEKLVVLGP